MADLISGTALIEAESDMYEEIVKETMEEK